MATDRSTHPGRSADGAHALTRVAVAGSAGLAAFGVVIAIAPWQVAVMAGWDTTAIVIVVWVFAVVRRKDAAGTAVLATREDDSRAASDLVLVSAAVASLATVAFGLVKAGQEQGLTKAGMIALTVFTVFLSWGAVHTVYVLRYAHLFYSARGGIDFHDSDAPDYRDFAYVALTVGMTYQVSDTELNTKPIRRTVIRHALLSYLFGTVIVAVMINVVASLLR